MTQPKQARNESLALIIKALYVIFLAIALNGCETTPTVSSKPQTSTNATISSGELSDLEMTQYKQALTYLEKGDTKKSSRNLRKLLGKHPNHQGLRINLGTALYKNKDFEAANDVVMKGVQQPKAVADLHNLAGLIAIEMKDFPKAESQYLKALSIDKNHSYTHYNLALLYDQYYQDIEKAFKHYTIYLGLINHTDEATKDWVDQLKYSLDRE